MFEGRVCLRGKDLRVWSAARPEIQATFVAAMDFLRAPASLSESVSTEDTSGKGKTRSTEKKVSALELAKLLCKSFVATPVQTLVMGDDESAAMKRVAFTMSAEYKTIVVPLKEFLLRQMKMPVVMHDVLVTCVRGLLGAGFIF